MKSWGDKGAFHGRSSRMIYTIALLRKLPSIGFYIFFFVTALILGQTSSTHSVFANEKFSKPRAIVIGFVGGFIKHDNPVHSEVQLAARLRKEYPAGVDVETFESYHGEKAHHRILELLDTNHNGTLTEEEKKNA